MWGGRSTQGSSTALSLAGFFSLPTSCSKHEIEESELCIHWSLVGDARSLMNRIGLYAEYLLNLHQVSVYATLPSKSNQGTKASIDENTPTFIIEHDGGCARLMLPCKVKSNQTLSPSLGDYEQSFRLIADASNTQYLYEREIEKDPWSAATLPTDISIACKSCKYQLTDHMRQWKDLPSGGWADMMDLWHCHKPTVSNCIDSNAGINKGYSASNTSLPNSECGLVDVGSLAFLPGDCSGIKVSILFVYNVLFSFTETKCGQQEGDLSHFL